MNNTQYEELIRNGERVEWYGEMAPEGLITTKVRTWCNILDEEVHKLEGELSELKGVTADRRKAYLKALKNNLKNAPYTLNGDTYLIKKKRIEEELNKKEPVKKTRKRRTTKTTKTTSKTTQTPKKVTKNSSLIFGKNKNK